MPFQLRRFPVPDSVWQLLRPDPDEFDTEWIPVQIAWQKWVHLICKFLRRMQQKSYWSVLGRYCSMVKHVRPKSTKGVQRALMGFRAFRWGYSGPVTAVDVRWANMITKISVMSKRRRTFANFGMLFSNREPEDLNTGFDQSGSRGYWGCGRKFFTESHPCNWQ